jgi:hypothetical protein
MFGENTGGDGYRKEFVFELQIPKCCRLQKLLVTLLIDIALKHKQKSASIRTVV